MNKQIDILDQATGALPLASKNVLLVTCMDLRLLDNVVAFMEGENLTNRYDQFVSAGPSVSLKRPRLSDSDAFAACRNAFYDHLELAVALHEIKYIYIIDHFDCGAHRYASGFAQYGQDRSEDSAHHEVIINELRADILDYAQLRRDDPRGIPMAGETSVAGLRGTACHPFRTMVGTNGTKPLAELVGRIYADRYLRPPHSRDWEIQVFGFLMDLRGVVARVPHVEASPTRLAAKPKGKRRKKG